jgi:hypothetical protein
MGNSTTCPVYRPSDLAKQITPSTWSNCAGSMDCLKLDAPWFTEGEAVVGVAHWSAVPGGHRYLGLREGWAVGKEVAVLYDVDTGLPLGAWGGGGTCAFVDHLWRDRAVVAVKEVPGTYRIYWGATDGVFGAKDAVFVSSLEKNGSLGDSHLGDGILALNGGVIELASKAFIPFDFGMPASTEDPRTGGKSAFIQNHASTGDEEWVRREDRSMERLIAVPGVHVRAFGTDGVDMAWLQASEPTGTAGVFSRWELWTAPLATTKADLAPKKLTRIPEFEGVFVGHRSLVVGGKHAMVYAKRNVVFSLLDGSRHIIPDALVAPLDFRHQMYVDADEAILQLSQIEHGMSIARVKLAPLASQPAVP